MAGEKDNGAVFQGPGTNSVDCDLKVDIPCINGPKKYGSFRIKIIVFPKPTFEKPCLEKWYDAYREKLIECETYHE